MRIAYFQTAFLGDLLLAIPTLKNIKRIYPDCHLTLICRQGLGDIFSRLPFVDHCYELDKKKRQSVLLYRKWLKEQPPFDIFICPHESFRSHWMSLAVRSSMKIGFWKWWNPFFFQKRVSRKKSLPDALRQMSLIIGLDKELEGKIALSEKNPVELIEVEDWASMKLSSSFWQTHTIKSSGNIKPYICCAPGSVWPTKRWTQKGFAEVCRNFQAMGYDVFLVGAPNEFEICEKISQISGATNLAGKKSLWESLCFLRGAKLLISNDSGAQHMASVSETPTVSIFGPTVISQGYQPWQNQIRIVEKKLSCRPCGAHGGLRCPIKTHECMVGLSPQEVVKQGVSLLSSLGNL